MISLKRILQEVVLLQESKREQLLYCMRHNINKIVLEKIYGYDTTLTKKYTLTILRWFDKYKKEDKLNPNSPLHASRSRGMPVTDEDIFFYFIRVPSDMNYTLYWVNPFEFYRKNMDGDIQQFTSIQEFSEALGKEIQNNQFSKRQLKKIAKDETAREKVFENEKCTIFLIKKREAACVYGAGTQWCITQRHMSHFENYNAEANIYFLIDKKDNSNKFAVLSYPGRLIREWKRISNVDKRNFTKINNIVEVYEPKDTLIYATDVDFLKDFYAEDGDQVHDDMLSFYKEREIDGLYNNHEYVEEDFAERLVTKLFNEKKIYDFNETCRVQFSIPDGLDFFTYRLRGE